MKTKISATIKFSASIVTVFLLHSFLYATTPGKSSGKSKQQQDETVQLMIEKYAKDIELTESQQASLLEKTTIFVTKLQEANELAAQEDAFQLKSDISQQYELELDSILGQTKKQQLDTKRKERKEKAIKETKEKKNK